MTAADQDTMAWPANGVHEGVPFGLYRSDDINQSDDNSSIAGKAVSKSLICDFINDPAAWKASPPKKQTAAMKGGSLFDCLLTEPETFGSRYAVAPEIYVPIDHVPRAMNASNFPGEWNARSKDCREWKAEQESAGWVVLTEEKVRDLSEPREWNLNAGVCREWFDQKTSDGLSVITTGELLTAQEQVAALCSHPDAARLVNMSRKQVAYRHKTKHKFASKGLLDLLPEDPEEGIVDIKTCEPSAMGSKRSLSAHIYKWRYHIQAGAYADGYSFASGEERIRFRFIFVTSKPPYRVAVVELPFAAVMFGADQYRAGINRFAACMESGKWPSIWDGEVELDLPEYAYTENES